MTDIAFRRSCLLLLGTLCLVLGGMIAADLWFNQGHFIYTLDDPYIHLRLAEQLARGHYGLNAGEFASPSSSFLWPFLLVPFAPLSWGEYVPLAFATLSCIATGYFMLRALSLFHPRHAVWITLAVLLLTNSFGLVLTGMENSLQVLIAVAVTSALIEVTEGRQPGWWLWAGILIGPMIRYELLGVSLGAAGIMMLVYRRYIYLLPFGLSVSVLAGFSWFLHAHTGHWLPASVVAKLTVVSQSQTNLASLWSELAMSLWLVWQMRRTPRRPIMAWFGLYLLAAHMLVGRSGWFERYEVYVLAAVALVLCTYLPQTLHYPWLRRRPLDALALIGIPLVLCFLRYPITTVSSPAASHVIDAQQVQMRRFADIARASSIAVNDIGYISFHNPHPVRDVWGLGQLDVQALRTGKAPGWLGKAAGDATLAMVYKSWYEPSAIPTQWVSLGTLELKHFPGLLNYLIGGEEVEFYATGAKEVCPFRAAIPVWKKDLPVGATWKDAPAP